MHIMWLWFDVGIETYTTVKRNIRNISWLWFDVGIETYTTRCMGVVVKLSCGLM